MSDAVLLVGFGGPGNPSEIRPFVLSVLEGRPVPPQRIDEVVDHYLQVGGASPYVAETRRLAEALGRALVETGSPLPVLVGYRHSEPRLVACLAEARDRGIRRLAAVAMTPWGGSDAGDRYATAVRAAVAATPGAPEIVWVPAFYAAAGFLDGWADRIRAQAPRGAWRLLFTAHSVPLSAAEPYRSQVSGACAAIASRLGRNGDWTLAWQSRSGHPGEAWLEPDVLESLGRLAAEGSAPVLAAPVGFLCEHVEILFDLGVEARAEAARLGLPLAISPAISDHPLLARQLALAAAEALE